MFLRRVGNAPQEKTLFICLISLNGLLENEWYKLFFQVLLVGRWLENQKYRCKSYIKHYLYAQVVIGKTSTELGRTGSIPVLSLATVN